MLRQSFNSLLAKYNQLFHQNISEEAYTLTFCCICEFRYEKVPATHQCLDCSDTLCQGCQGGHLLSRATHAHTVVPIQEAIKGRGHLKRWNASAQICPKHFGQPHRFFCRSCSIVICSICFLKQHKEHTVDNIDIAAKECQKDLQLSSVQLREQKHETLEKDRLRRFEEMRKKTEDKKESLLSEIRSVCQSDISFILESENHALSSVVNYCDSQIQAIKSSAEEIKERADIAEATGVVLNNILTDKDSAKCLILRDNVTAIMREYDHDVQTDSDRLSSRCMGVLNVEVPETPPVRHISIKQRKVDRHWEDISEEQILHIAEETFKEIADSDEEFSSVLRKTETRKKFQLKRLEDTSNPFITGLSIFDEKNAKLVVSDSGNMILRLITVCGLHVTTYPIDEGQVIPFHSIATLPGNIVFTSGSRLCITDSCLQLLRHTDLTDVFPSRSSDTFLPLSEYRAAFNL